VQEGPLGDVQGRLFEKYMEACDELSGSEDEDRCASASLPKRGARAGGRPQASPGTRPEAWAL
jgi:hypothetical protein